MLGKRVQFDDETWQAIQAESTAGFKPVLGASVSAIAVGGFVGAKTSA
jgi:hypothetical protein